MSLTATVEALVDAGATPQMILAVVRAHEASSVDALAERRARDAARQQARRDRGNHVMSRDVTECPRDSVTAPAPPSFLPPRPPNQTTPTPPDITTRARRALRRCPADWAPKPETFGKLAAEGFQSGDLERALTRMRDHEFKTARTDWDATFRNWVRNDADRPPPRPHHERLDAKQSAQEANLTRAFNGGLTAIGRAGG